MEVFSSFALNASVQKKIRNLKKKKDNENKYIKVRDNSRDIKIFFLIQ